MTEKNDINSYLENSNPFFSGDTSEYCDCAIAKNIIHSLETEDDSRELYEFYNLYASNTFSNVINRVLERENQLMIANNIKNNDLNLLSTENDEILKNVTQKQIKKILMYLYKLDILKSDKWYILNVNRDQKFSYSVNTSNSICRIPNIRYKHAFNFFSDSTIKEELITQIVRDETQIALNYNKNFFVGKIKLGEYAYDMIIYNKTTNSCQLYSLTYQKYNNNRKNEYFNKIIEYFFGKIKSNIIVENPSDFLLNINSYILF